LKNTFEAAIYFIIRFQDKRHCSHKETHHPLTIPVEEIAWDVVIPQADHPDVVEEEDVAQEGGEEIQTRPDVGTTRIQSGDLSHQKSNRL
jgi:hypothetical protein